MEEISFNDITKEQWEAYRIIKNMGLHNMHTDPQAVRDSGLDEDVYFIVQMYFDELSEKFKETDDE